MSRKSVFEKERTTAIAREKAPWAPEEELGEYQLKRWSWFEKEDALFKATVILDEELGKGEVVMGEFHAHMVLKCTTPPPALAKQWTLDRVKNLDPDVGTELKNQLVEINGLSFREKRVFLGHSDQEKDTPG